MLCVLEVGATQACTVVRGGQLEELFLETLA